MDVALRNRMRAKVGILVTEASLCWQVDTRDWKARGQVCTMTWLPNFAPPGSGADDAAEACAGEEPG